ncbi:MAG TPA: hypothetical protein VH559_10340, partial [Gemmatimonadaceae bacterium]
LQPRPREEPVQVGMRERGREAAGATLLTGRAVGVFAQQHAAQPEGDLLLADAAGSLEQQAARERPPTNDVGESLANRVVSV